MNIDHIHFYVEDAKAWRDWFVSHLGFQAVADYAFPLKGSFHTCTEVVKSGPVYFLLSSPILPISPVAEFLCRHPPGVADIAFGVEDVEATIALAEGHGAKVLQTIEQYQQGNLYIKWGKIAAWGSLTHTLIERATDDFTVSPTVKSSATSATTFTAIDHIVLNVAAGDLERAVAWYESVLDFQPQQTFKIKTDRSALYSQVMVSRNGCVQLPINEPASANSQIQEFLDVNHGPGIQHIALQTGNIINAIAQFRAAGLSLLSVPKSYYSHLQQRKGLPLSAQETRAIAQLEILVDWNQQSNLGNMHVPLLLQIFTQPIFGQPTFFFELIERRSQAQGFGEGNFRTLFEAIEREQIKRGSMKD
ncbi:MAG: 4-hydroxyphenylpyruvate dioxygenase [Stigonema ocellatum SAG 48.90 = DSM 106950]|nr:4-hydroxyphenylpyruvate dioxygenase [Stigonema ocellatum SAG 48.90 = DSM 106950]